MTHRAAPRSACDPKSGAISRIHLPSTPMMILGGPRVARLLDNSDRPRKADHVKAERAKCGSAMRRTNPNSPRRTNRTPGCETKPMGLWVISWTNGPTAPNEPKIAMTKRSQWGSGQDVPRITALAILPPAGTSARCPRRQESARRAFPRTKPTGPIDNISHFSQTISISTRARERVDQSDPRRTIVGDETKPMVIWVNSRTNRKSRGRNEANGSLRKTPSPLVTDRRARPRA